MTQLDAITRFRRLRPADRDVLLRALMLLPLVGLSVRTVGLARTVALLSQWSGASSAILASDWNPRAWNIMRLMRAATRRGFVRGNCLSQSLTLWALLRRAGIASELRIGARKAEGKFLAHAWIEVAGFPLNESVEQISRYAMFEALPIPNGIKWA